MVASKLPVNTVFIKKRGIFRRLLPLTPSYSKYIHRPGTISLPPTRHHITPIRKTNNYTSAYGKHHLYLSLQNTQTSYFIGCLFGKKTHIYPQKDELYHSFYTTQLRTKQIPTELTPKHHLYLLIQHTQTSCFIGCLFGKKTHNYPQTDEPYYSFYTIQL